MAQKPNLGQIRREQLQKQILQKQEEGRRQREAYRGAIQQVKQPVVPMQAMPSRAASGESAVLTRSQLDTAAINKAAKESKAAGKMYDDYLKSEARKANVDTATNEVLKKVFSNLGTGNLDIQLQNAPKQVLDAETTEKTLRAKKDYAEQQVDAAKDTKTLNDGLEELRSWSKEDIAGLQAYIREEDQRFYGQNRDALSMDTNPESTALIQKYGPEKVQQMAHIYTRDQNQSLARDVDEQARRSAGGGLLKAAGHSATSVGANVLSGISGPLGYMRELAMGPSPSTTLDPNNVGQLPSIYAGAVRQQVGEDIENSEALKRVGAGIAGAMEYQQTGAVPTDMAERLEKADGKAAGKIGSTLYKAGMGAADTAARAALGGGSKLVSLGLAAGNSFGNTVREASAKGASGKQAMLLGAVNAGIEVATEYIPLDELLKTARNSTAGAKDILMDVLKQAGIEATTEEISLIGTTLAEAAILREKAGYNQQIQEAVAQGASYAQAKQEADRALLAEAGETAILSALSGGMSTAGAAIAAKGPAITQNAKETVRDKGQEAAQLIADSFHQVIDRNKAGKTDAAQNSSAIAQDSDANTRAKETAKIFTDTADQLERQERGRRYRATKVNTAILDLVDKVKRGIAKGSEKVALGTVSERNAEKIQMETGIDVRGYNVAIEARQIDHILKDHGENGAANRSMANPEDIAKIEYALNNPDRITKSKPTKAYVTNKNGKMKPADTVLYEAQLEDGSYYVVQAVPETKKKTLYVLTAFIGEPGYKNTEAPQSTNAADPGATPKAESTVTPKRATQSTDINNPDATLEAESVGTSMNSIPNQGGIVNENPSGNRPREADSQRASAVDGQRTESGIPEGFESVGAATAGFDPFTRMQLDYGNIPDGENAVRPDDMPVSTNGTDRVSYTARTVKGAQVTPESFIGDLEDLVVKGGMSYIPIKNDEVAKKAAQRIKEMGWASARANWSANVRAGKTGANMTATGAILLNNAANAGDKQAWLEILDEYRKLGTNTAQGLQAFRILKKLAPDDQLYLIDRSLSQMVEDMHLDTKITIDKDLRKAYREAETREAKDKALEAIQQNVADQIPSTAMDKWTALRYLNMLGNFRTQVRNVTGNVGNSLVYAVKDKIGAALERVFLKSEDRTKSLALDRDTVKVARADFDKVQSVIQNGGKYNDAGQKENEFEQAVQDKRQIFKSDNKAINTLLKPLEGYRNVTNWAMEQGDIIFSRSAYAKALAGFLKAHNVTAEQFLQMENNPGDRDMQHIQRIPDGAKVRAADRDNLGTVIKYNADSNTYDVHFVSPEGRTATVKLASAILQPAETKSQGKVPAKTDTAAFVDYARAYAIREAQETTFRDNNAVSDWISKVGRRKDTPKAAKMVAEGIIPFRKTPANVLVRAEEYSPLGFINSAVKTVQAAKGEATGAEVINSWAKTLTGTGLFALGAALGNMGVLTGGPDPDEEKAEFDELNGFQNYALQLPDGTNLTIDFLSPTAMPMFMGAQMAKIIADGGYTLADFEEMFTSLADPMIQMSMLQGVNDTIDNIKYSENNLGQMLMNATMSYLTQGISNTLMGQLERSSEDSRMTTYVDKDSDVPVWLQRQLGKISAKTPGWDYQQTPYLNAWGEEEKNPEGAKDYLYNLFSPSYIDKAEVDNVATELYRLNEVQSDINVFPQSPEGKLTYTDKDGNRQEDYNLSMEQLQKLKQTEGQTQAKLAAELIGAKDYQALTDDQKAKAISLVYDYAREKGRVEAIADYAGFSDSWMEGIGGKETAAIIQKVASADLSDAMSAMTDSWKNNRDDTEAREALERAYQVYNGLSVTTKKALQESASGRLGYYLEARKKGIDTETFVGLYETYWDIDRSDAKTADKAQKWAYALERAEETGKITASQKAMLKDSMVYYQMFPAETEKFDQLTEGGLTAKAAQDLGYLLKGIKPQEGYTSVRDIQKAETIMGASLSEADKIAALKIYGTDKQDEKLDAMTGMGFSAADYVTAWRIYADASGTGKKARTIAAYQKRFGVDYATAKAIYDIYG